LMDEGNASSGPVLGGLSMRETPQLVCSRRKKGSGPVRTGRFEKGKENYLAPLLSKGKDAKGVGGGTYAGPLWEGMRPIYGRQRGSCRNVVHDGEKKGTISMAGEKVFRSGEERGRRVCKLAGGGRQRNEKIKKITCEGRCPLVARTGCIPIL